MEEVVYEKGEVSIEPIRNDDSGVGQHPRPKSFKKKTYAYTNDAEGGRGRKAFTPPKDIVKTFFTDGGSRPYDLPEGRHYVGAWAFYDVDTGELVGGSDYDVTNNQMELMAVMNALKYCDNLGVPRDKWVCIKLDSEYVRYGVLFWVKKWIANNWYRKNKVGVLEEVKNRELWEEIYELATSRRIYWEHVPAHSGLEGNEKVDTKCAQLIREYADEHGITERMTAPKKEASAT